MHDGVKVCIAYPSGEFVHNKFLGSLFNLWAYSMAHVQVDLKNVVSCRVASNRNWLVEQAKAIKATHILFIDADSVVPPESIIRLLAYDKDIVGATTARRGDEEGTPVGSPLDPNDLLTSKKLIKMHTIGLPLMLIKMDVFDRLAKPYFAEPPKEDGSLIPEDVYFCQAVRKAGMDLWCDMELSLMVGHVGTKVYQVKDAETKQSALKVA